jgi:transcription initiation factor TFIIB
MKKRISTRMMDSILNSFQVEEGEEESEEEIEKGLCTSCLSILKLSEDGYMVCSSVTCGRIYKDILDHTAEWRNYSENASDPTRCGMPINPLLRESSYGCRVVSKGITTYEMRKIMRYTEWQSMPYKEKSQYDEFERIKMMAANAGISKCIVNDALTMHNKISKEKTFRAQNRDGIIAASLYISCKKNKYPRTAKEIAQIFHLDKSSATRGCKNATLILNKLERNLEGQNKTSMCHIKPITFIDRYCSRLNLNAELTKLCQFIALQIEKNNLIPENTPHSIATGIIYFVSQICNLNISKKDVRVVSDISEVTINKCCKKLKKYENTIIPKCIIEKYGKG